MNKEKQKWFLAELYHKYSNYFPADLWAYLIMIAIIAIAAIFIL
jgi:hypothetical protein